MPDDDADEQCQEEVARLREKVAELLRQARVLLHGDAQSKPSPRPVLAKRAEREQELEKALEKADWYRQEIRRLQKELDSRGAARGGGNPSWDQQERDPMELQNLLAEKRKELQQLKRSGDGLDRIAEAQRRAEAVQNSMTPENAEKLQRIKDEVEKQRRLNVKLFSDRQKLVNACKKTEAQVRTAEQELRNKAAELRLPPRIPGGAGGGGARDAGKDASSEPQVLKQLQRDVDILKEALRQDERRFRSSERAEEQEAESVLGSVRSLQKSVAEHEAHADRLRTELRESGARPEGTPQRPRATSLPPSPAVRRPSAGNKDAAAGAGAPQRRSSAPRPAALG